MYAVNTVPNIQKINQKYCESGHLYLECDGMHLLIERRKKHQVNTS